MKRPFGGVLASFLFAATIFGTGATRAADAVDAITVGQPPVYPYEFNGDLSKVTPIYRQKDASSTYTRPVLRPPPSSKYQLYQPTPAAQIPPGGPRAPMPPTIQNFAGVSFNDNCTGGRCGSGWPPDPNGDVGPNHYVQVVNSAVVIYNKTGTLLASFTEDNLWLNVGNSPCNGNSQGDPIALYDWIADRFIVTWFAFGVVGGSPVSPFYQCIAASKTSDPVAGGWWLYPVRLDPGTAGTPPLSDLNDYGKFGLWHDCLYMAANEFHFPGEAFDGVAFGSFSRANLYAGQPLTFALGYMNSSFNVFTMIPSNNLGSGANAVQAGTPNYFVSESFTAFAFEVRKFTAGANCGGGGTLSAATNVSQTSYPASNAHFGAVVPQPNTTTKLDNIGDRLMQKVQYRKVGGAESVWVTHAVDMASGQTAIQWAQINVTGGAIAATPVQQQIYSPDTTLYRFIPSLAVDKMGNMAMGFSTSGTSAPNFPSILYAGRLVTDPLNALPQTEVAMAAGQGSQTNNCGGPCDRWGDYSGMGLDPADDCTFWYSNQYYTSQTNGTAGNWNTRIGSFKFPNCVGGPPPVLRKFRDFNGDGKADILWRDATAGTTTMWLMNGGGSIGMANLLTNTQWVPTHTGFFDPDNNADILWHNSVTGATALWFMNGTTQIGSGTLLVDPNWAVTHVADFSGDGKADLLWYNNSTHTTSMWVMNGLAILSTATLLVDPNWKVIFTGDFNGDGRSDLVWFNAATHQTAIWLMNGTTFLSGGIVLTAANWTVVGVGDFNGDGRSDLLWNNPVTGETAVWLMNGTTMTSGAIVLTNTQWVPVFTGDFDGDGKSDIVFHNATTGQTALWLMNGTAMASGAIVLTNTQWSVVQVADFDGDHKSDLLWRNSVTKMHSLWTMNGLVRSTGTNLGIGTTFQVIPAP